jgi:hypothetical protein
MYVGWSVEEENIFTVDVRFIRSTVAYVNIIQQVNLNILQITLCGHE